MTPQQNMANGNWPIPQRANWNQPTVVPSSTSVPAWLQNLIDVYSNQQANNQMMNNQYQAQPQSQQSPQNQSPTQQSLVGRHINNISEVKPIEIPMDGTATYFPTFDGSSIYLRYWDQDGQIKGVRYIPEVTTDEVATLEGSKIPSFPTVQEINDAIAPQIDSLGSRLSAIESILAGAVAGNASTNRGNSKPKKEETLNA